jgi:hypothetical protein
MKHPLFLIFAILILSCSAAFSQANHNTADPFPTPGEFPEIEKVFDEKSLEDLSGLSKIENGRLFEDVGFSKLSRRSYRLREGGTVTVTITALIDFRAAYSLLTLLRNNPIQEGPPGDAFSRTPGRILFFQGSNWVLINGDHTSEELLRRMAVFVSERLGPRGRKPPSLISHFPKTGFDVSGLRYFPGVKPFETFSSPEIVKALHIQIDAEIAESRYALQGQEGTMFLISFPTGEIADEYFAEFSEREVSGTKATNRFARKAGPIVAILEGRFSAAAADNILGTLSYSYSIQWIYEKGKKSKVAWGIPVSLLQTVVKSILFVALLCLIAIIIGAASALLRHLYRGGFSKTGPDQPERPDITRLRLR